MGCIIEQYPNTKLWTKLLEIEADVLNIVHERLSCKQNTPSLIGSGQTFRFSISVIDNSSGPVPAASIVAGTYDLIRIQAGIETTIQNDAPFTKTDGLVYVDIEFDTATWDADDAYILAPNIDSTATLDGTVYYLPIAPWSGMVFDLSDITSKLDHITGQIDNGTYGLEATKNEIDNIEAKLDNGTFGLDALNTDLDTLLGRLTATRAGYLDYIQKLSTLTAARIGYLDYINNINLSTISNISTLNAVNIGYLANINNAQLLNVPNLSTLTAARIGYLDNIDQAGLLQITAARAGYLNNINNGELLNIPNLSTLTAARIGYLDYLANATYGLEALEVNQQGIAADNCISDGNVYYVSLSGDNTTGLTWATAMNTIDAAVGLCTSDNGDIIFVAPGTYNENANGAAGVTCDKIGITIKGVSIGVNVTNTDTTNGGYVFNITANRTVLENLKVYKEEVVSTGSICVNVNADGVRIFGITTDVEKAGFTGIKVLNGSVGTRIRGNKRRGQVFSTNAVGTGIDLDGTMADVCDVAIRQLTVGVELGANSDNNVINDTVAISDCTTGIHLSAGAQSNTMNALLAACTTNFNDASGNATNDRHSSLTHIHQDITHIPKISGETLYVNKSTGLDTNSGHGPCEALKTIAVALAAASTADRVVVMATAGKYNEAGLTMATQGVELLFESGTMLEDTGGGDVLTVTASDCRLTDMFIDNDNNGGKCFVITGLSCVASNCVAMQGTVGFEVDCNKVFFEDCIAIDNSTTQFDIQTKYGQYFNCVANGDGQAVRGFYLSDTTADLNSFVNCHSLGNTTAGWEVVANANENIFCGCCMGGNDGAKVDNGTNNTWPNFGEGSQITAGQSRDQDLSDIYDSIGTVSTQKTEVNEVVIYPVSEHAGTTEIIDDGTSPAYYADTEAGTAIAEANPNVHWSEDINFENAGTITIISMYLEMEWEHKTSAGTAYSKIQISRDSGANWIDVTDSIAETNAAYQAKLREGVGNFIPTIVAGANQLEFRLVSWEAGGETSSAKIRSNSYVRITYRKS